MSEQTQQQNDITQVRNVLFDTLRSLSDKENPMEIERAAAIKDVAQTIINSAKVEVEALKVLGGNGTGFIPVLTAPAKPIGGQVREIRTGEVIQEGNVLRHTSK
ncbi:MAG: hypothetical protein WCT35_04735 [Sideroxydans sp.]|jgi:hypothetical protein